MKAKRVFFDCETVGTRDPDVREMMLEELRGEETPAQIRGGSADERALMRAGMLDYYRELKKDKGAWLAEVWNRENVVEARLAEMSAGTSVDTLLAEVIVAGVAVDDGDPIMYSDQVGGEEPLIQRMMSYLGQVSDAETVWIGHNIEGFDLPLLITRCRRYGIIPPDHFPAWRGGRARGRVYDTMREVATSRPFTSAQRAAVAHGLGAFKSVEWDGAPMDGSRVGEAYAAGEIDMIMEYCEADVAAVRELARALTFEWRMLGDGAGGGGRGAGIGGWGGGGRGALKADDELMGVAMRGGNEKARLNELVTLLLERGIIGDVEAKAMVML